jgi:hypothetical protein
VKQFLILVSTACFVTACASDSTTAVRAIEGRSKSMSVQKWRDQLAEPYTHAIRGGDSILSELEMARSQSHDDGESRYDSRVRFIRNRIASWERDRRNILDGHRDSMIASVSPDESGPGPGEVLMAGIIDELNSTTDVNARQSRINVQTFVTVPARLITHTTTGTLTVLGRETPIFLKAEGFYGGLNSTFRLDEVNCAEYGATINVSTFHEASWKVWKLPSLTLGTHRSAGDDGGECPPVPPRPAFMMSGGGSSAPDGSILSLKAPPGGSVPVTFTASGTTGDATSPIYEWFINGESIGAGMSATYTMRTNNVGVALRIRGMNGLSGIAEGAIGMVIEAPPTSGGGESTGPEESCNSTNMVDAIATAFAVAVPCDSRVRICVEHTIGEWNPETGEVYWSYTWEECYYSDQQPQLVEASTAPFVNAATAGTSVTLIGTTTLSAGPRVRVLRKGGSAPRLVVVIDTATATMEEILASLQIAANAHAIVREPNRDQQFVVRSSHIPTAKKREGAKLVEKLRRELEKAPAITVPGVGRARVLEYTIPVTKLRKAY